MSAGDRQADNKENRYLWPDVFRDGLLADGSSVTAGDTCVAGLYPRLHGLGLRSLELHLAVARMDTPREHNSIVVTAPRQPFAEGLVLDAWRQSGCLWFGALITDKYPWQPLPRDRVPPELENLFDN